MQMPSPNINGTAVSDLVESYGKAMVCLNHAIEALAECAPHGRDYQTLPDPNRALQVALHEYSERQLKLRQVRMEIELLCEHVMS